MALVGKYIFVAGLVIAAAGGLGFEQAWFGWGTRSARLDRRILEYQR